jgi:methyltransferase (TIGR00027 family)
MRDEHSPVIRTAYRVMFYVALEQYQPEGQRLINDDLAYQMLPGRLQFLLNLFSIKPLRQGFLNLIEKGFHGTSNGLCRKRYIDEQLIGAINCGFESVVILGAGLDTLAYRIPQLATATIYEVDLPQVIDYKKEKLEQLYGLIPPHVRLIPIDFDHQQLENVLLRHGFLLDRKSFIVWEGVTQYLTELGVRDVFRFLSKFKPGSRIVFTYILKDFIDGEKMYGLERLYDQARKMWQFGLLPGQVPSFLGEFSWKEIEQAGAEEFQQRYLKPMGRSGSVMEIERMVLAEKV